MKCINFIEKKSLFQDIICCAYGAAGVRADAEVEGYDCLMIPGALKADIATPAPVSQCGRSLGLVTAAAINAAAGGKTVCSKYE